MNIEHRDISPNAEYEQEVRRRVHTFSAPLLRSVWNHWGNQELTNGRQRGWLNCSPASVIGSRVLNANIDGISGSPIILNGDPQRQEFIQLPDLIYDPREKGGMEDDMSDHVAIFYHTGRGFSYYIDFIYRPLWGSNQLTGDSTNEELSNNVIFEPWL